MVLQVGAVRHRMPVSDAEDREALHNVEHAGRTALAEMRRLLDAMRSDEDQLDLTPQPGLDMLPGLLEDVRAAGLDVRLEVDGEPRTLPPGLDLSAYRILQEGLTNVLKHAHAQHRPGPDPLRRARSSSSRSATTAAARPPPTASATDWSASVSGSRSTAVK